MEARSLEKDPRRVYVSSVAASHHVDDLTSYYVNLKVGNLFLGGVPYRYPIFWEGPDQ
jgi:hypothetical protein